MKIFTTRSLILRVVERWREQYRNYHSNHLHDDKKLILSKLQSLDLTTATAEEVNAIIGNSNWTTARCDECDKSVD